MRYAQIRSSDIANGPGIRTSLYLQGCSRRCRGCFNPETWDFHGGTLWDMDIENRLIELIGRPQIVGVSILGGEPLELCNRLELKILLERIKREYPGKSIWLYTSFLYEELILECPDILGLLDVIVDGEFVLEQKGNKLQYKGSSNQRVISIKESIEKGLVCLYK